MRLKIVHSAQIATWGSLSGLVAQRLPKQTEMAFHGKYKAKTHATRCNPAPYHTVIRLKFIEAVSKVQANTSDGVASGQSDAVIKATANARH
jgi:hypothetical protein